MLMTAMLNIYCMCSAVYRYSRVFCSRHGVRALWQSTGIKKWRLRKETANQKDGEAKKKTFCVAACQLEEEKEERERGRKSLPTPS